MYYIKLNWSPMCIISHYRYFMINLGTVQPHHVYREPNTYGRLLYYGRKKYYTINIEQKNLKILCQEFKLGCAHRGPCHHSLSFLFSLFIYSKTIQYKENYFFIIKKDPQKFFIFFCITTYRSHVFSDTYHLTLWLV